MKFNYRTGRCDWELTRQLCGGGGKWNEWEKILTRYLNAFYCNLIYIESAIHFLTAAKNSHTKKASNCTKTHNQLIIWWASKSVICCLSSTSTEHRLRLLTFHSVLQLRLSSPLFFIYCCRLHRTLLHFPNHVNLTCREVLSFSLQFFFFHFLLTSVDHSRVLSSVPHTVALCLIADNLPNKQWYLHAWEYQHCSVQWFSSINSQAKWWRRVYSALTRSQHDVLHSNFTLDKCYRECHRIGGGLTKAGPSLWDAQQWRIETGKSCRIWCECIKLIECNCLCVKCCTFFAISSRPAGHDECQVQLHAGCDVEWDTWIVCRGERWIEKLHHRKLREIVLSQKGFFLPGMIQCNFFLLVHIFSIIIPLNFMHCTILPSMSPSICCMSLFCFTAFSACLTGKKLFSVTAKVSVLRWNASYTRHSVESVGDCGFF